VYGTVARPSFNSLMHVDWVGYQLCRLSFMGWVHEESKWVHKLNFRSRQE